MCRVEERIYIRADGHRSKFEETFHCDKSRKGKLCADVKKRTSEYYPNKGNITRSDTPSPINPPTPTGGGTYIVRPRRPSSSGGLPSSHDGQKALKPEIIIEFGSNKSNGKKYPLVSVSTKAYKRSSLGTTSNDDIAVESPGSDASHTVRTGFIEAPLAPYGQSDGYSTTPTLPHGYHHRNTSSTSSYTGSSRTPSLYITSDPELESPTNTRGKRLPPAIHNPSNSYAPPPSPSKSRANNGVSSSGYNTTLITPHSISVDSRAADSSRKHDYIDPAGHSTSSHTSSGASGKSRRGKEPEQSGRRKDEHRSRQEEVDRQAAEALARDNVKQVRFKDDRAGFREKERAENRHALKEMDRAALREEARRQEARRRDQEKRNEEAARERRREQERSKPVISNSSSRRPSSRRGSMTQAERNEQQRLVNADLHRMQNEVLAAEAREREERAATLKQQQQDPAYYNPRTGGMPTNAPSLGRRHSQSRRESFSSDVRPTLARSNGNPRRASIVQPNPPTINTHVTSSGYARPPSARTHQSPPVSYHNSANTRPPSARRSSFSSQEAPFITPLSARGSGSSMDNPFAAAPSVLSSSAVIHQDPWDARSMSNALPASSRQTDSRYTIERRGQDVLRNAAQRASRGLHRSTFDSDSE